MGGVICQRTSCPGSVHLAIRDCPRNLAAIDAKVFFWICSWPPSNLALAKDILLLLPEGDQYSAVSQVLLAMQALLSAERDVTFASLLVGMPCQPQVDVYVTNDTNKAFVIDRTNIRVGGEESRPCRFLGSVKGSKLGIRNPAHALQLTKEWCPTRQWRVPANELLGTPGGGGTPLKF